MMRTVCEWIAELNTDCFLVYEDHQELAALLAKLKHVARAAKERHINAERWDRGPDWIELREALKEVEHLLEEE